MSFSESKGERRNKDMENLYDVIVIGSGPAGITAGIYGRRAGLSTLIIEGNYIQGGQILIRMKWTIIRVCRGSAEWIWRIR